MTVKKTKLTFEEAERAFSVLTFEAKNSIKGGCGPCEGWEEEGATVYSQEEYSYLSSQSLWAGGNVCGIGYVPSQTSESETTTDIPSTEDSVADDMDSTIDDTTTIPDESTTSDETESSTVPTDTTDDPSTTFTDESEATREPEATPEEPETTGEPGNDGGTPTPPDSELPYIRIEAPEGFEARLTDAVYITFPDYIISYEGQEYSNLGHAGVLLINNETGLTKYYEYGRYKTDMGEVYRRTISNVVIGEDGTPTMDSLNKVMGEISALGKSGRIEGAYIKSDEFAAMNDYAKSKEQEREDDTREPYDKWKNNCGHFAEDVICQDPTVDKPSIFLPTPINFVDEYQEEGNARVQYDPTTGKTTIGQGNEEDAKIKH